MDFALLNLFFCFLIFINADEEIDEDVYDVIILGAGMTGISAATELYANGIENILIIEAQDYIGGRIKTIEFGTKNKVNVNIGTSWIYGACTTWYCDSDDPLIKEDNPVKLLADHYDISYVHDDFNSENYYDFLDTNTQINFDNLWEYYINYANATECINAQYHDFQALESNEPDKLISFRDGLTACNWSEPSDKESRYVEWYEYDWEEGVSPDVTNVLSFIWPLTLYGDENLYVNDANGFQGIVEAMTDEFSLESKIKLNEPVTDINYENSDEIIVTTTMGNTYKSKYVIVTFSLGVLQGDSVAFNPALPAWKTDAINVMKMSDYCVMYFEWPYDFWTNKSNFMNTTYLVDNDTAESEQLIFIDDGMYGGYYAWAKNLNHEKYQYFANKNIWQIDVTDQVAFKVQTQPKQTTVNEIKTKLLNYFQNVPEPLAVVISNWTLNEYTRGAWAHWTLEGREDDWDLIGKNVDNVYFSGDSTSSKHFALVSGAYLHGIDTAEEILSKLKGEGKSGLSAAVIGVIIALIVIFVICIVIIVVMLVKRKKMKGAVTFKGTQNDEESDNKGKQQAINTNPTDDQDENVDEAEDVVPLTENM